MMRAFVRILAALVLSMTGAFAIAAEPQDIGWKDLLPETQTYDDPFADLEFDQISDLASLLRIEMQLENSANSEKRQEADALREKLVAQGLDPDWLFEQRLIVMEHRRRASEDLNAEVVGQSIRLPGYLLPLNMVDQKAVEFLLVPTVGACIHVPPPPPNQIVYVRYEEGFKVNGLYQPVWVSGEIKAEKQMTELNYVDGAADIDVGYAIDAVTVDLYQ
jgi:hypothetical protein